MSTIGPSPRPIRILLVDDNDVFREAVELLLGLRSDMEVIASARDGGEAVDACREQRPDVVLLDYRLPSLDGVQTTIALREVCPATSVICLTASIGPAERRAILDAGAVACLSKDQELDTMVDAIRRAAGSSSGNVP